MSKPEIELYMFSLNQEFPMEKGHHTFLSRSSKPVIDVDGKLKIIDQVGNETYKIADEASPRDWPGQWLHNQWIENHTKIGKADIASHEALDRILLREEDFGGIAFDPVNDKIYKVNKEGFALLTEIVNQFRSQGITSLRSFKSNTFNVDDAQLFLVYLKGAGILPE